VTLKLSREEAWDLFGAYALGALTVEEADAVRETVAGWREGEAELVELMETAAVLPLVPEDDARPSIALEGRMIAEARKRPSSEQVVARVRGRMVWWKRHLPHAMAAGFAAIAVTLGVLWLTEAEPLAQGRWLPLQTQVSDEPGGWVYVTDYERVPVSLLFWKTEASAVGTSYQLFRILSDGTTIPDAVFSISETGDGLVGIEPQPDTRVQGFAVVLIQGDEALTGTPSAESVVFTFPAR
jgi:hypothetical protein